jgi:hypothetical protein
MGEEFYSIIKLTTGEEIFSLVSIDENNDDPVIILQSPVVIKTFHHNGNTIIKIKPWIELSTDDIFVIRYDKVVTMTESKDNKLIDIYTKYLEGEGDETIEDSHQVDISTTIGYVSSVEEARKSLENLYNNIEDTKES